VVEANQLRGRISQELEKIGWITWRESMSRRSQDWNEGLARDLKNPEFAREFLMSSLEEGLSSQQALRKVILTYGLKEFSKRVKIPSSNISRALNPNHNPTLETLNKLLRPFGLKLTIAPIKEKAA
jgi:DNA-binding phage protein